MFVFNCTIDENRIASVSLSNSDKGSKKKKQKSHYKRFKTDQSNTLKGNDKEQEEDDILRPVLCSECGTELGVYEAKEELYHFSRILASH